MYQLEWPNVSVACRSKVHVGVHTYTIQKQNSSLLNLNVPVKSCNGHLHIYK